MAGSVWRCLLDSPAIGSGNENEFARNVDRQDDLGAFSSLLVVLIALLPVVCGESDCETSLFMTFRPENTGPV